MRALRGSDPILISIAVVSQWRLCAPDDDYWNVTAIHATSAHRCTDTTRQIEFDWRSKVWEFDETRISRQPGEFYRWLRENWIPSNDLNSTERFRLQFGTTGAMSVNVSRVVCTVSLDDFVTAAPDWRHFGERAVNTGIRSIALEGQKRCQLMLVFDILGTRGRSATDQTRNTKRAPRSRYIVGSFAFILIEIIHFCVVFSVTTSHESLCPNLEIKYANERRNSMAIFGNKAYKRPARTLKNRAKCIVRPNLGSPLRKVGPIRTAQCVRIKSRIVATIIFVWTVDAK